MATGQPLTLTPLGGGGYLAYRLLVTLALSLGAALVVVPPSGLVTVRPLALVAAAGGSRPADGQRRRTVDEHALGRFDGASLHGETVEPLEERRYRDGRLQSGERHAETVVGPVSEGDVTARVAVEVERPGVVEDGRVVVRAPNHTQSFSPGSMRSPATVTSAVAYRLWAWTGERYLSVSSTARSTASRSDRTALLNH